MFLKMLCVCVMSRLCCRSLEICQIATNVVIHHLRKTSFRHVGHTTNQLVDDDVIEGEFDMLSDGSELVPDMLPIRTDMNECICTLVDALPESYRTALALSDLEAYLMPISARYSTSRLTP